MDQPKFSSRSQITVKIQPLNDPTKINGSSFRHQRPYLYFSQIHLFGFFEIHVLEDIAEPCPYAPQFIQGSQASGFTFRDLRASNEMREKFNHAENPNLA